MSNNAKTSMQQHNITYASSISYVQNIFLRLANLCLKGEQEGTKRPGEYEVHKYLLG